MTLIPTADPMYLGFSRWGPVLGDSAPKWAPAVVAYCFEANRAGDTVSAKQPRGARRDVRRRRERFLDILREFCCLSPQRDASAPAPLRQALTPLRVGGDVGSDAPNLAAVWLYLEELFSKDPAASNPVTRGISHHIWKAAAGFAKVCDAPAKSVDASAVTCAFVFFGNLFVAQWPFSQRLRVFWNGKSHRFASDTLPGFEREGSIS